MRHQCTLAGVLAIVRLTTEEMRYENASLLYKLHVQAFSPHTVSVRIKSVSLSEDLWHLSAHVHFCILVGCPSVQHKLVHAIVELEVFFQPVDVVQTDARTIATVLSSSHRAWDRNFCFRSFAAKVGLGFRFPFVRITSPLLLPPLSVWLGWQVWRSRRRHLD